MRTVFILGAGSSLDFDRSGEMPVGSTLAAKIRASLDLEIGLGAADESSDSIQRIASLSGGHGSEQKQAMRTIRDHIHLEDSIDDLVDAWTTDRPEVARIAKICIARQIMLGEQMSLMSYERVQQHGPHQILKDVSDSWLAQIHRLHRKAEGIRRKDLNEVFSNVSFITFNYDRTVERYLSLAYTALGEMKEIEADDHVNKMPIYHVYGSLGALGLNHAMPYGGYQDATVNAWRGIKTYTEEVDTNHAAMIAETIRQADRMVFLGFGYHRQNMKILFPNDIGYGKEAYCNIMGLRERRKIELNSMLQNNVQFSNQSCGDMIRFFSEDLF